MLENSDFEPNYWSETATGFYTIGHDSIRLMKWICYYDRSYYENIKYFDLMGSVCKNFQTQQDPFAKNAQGISKIYHEVLLLMKFLQTKPQVKNMNINYYDLYYTVIKTRDENKDIDNQYEGDDNDCINFNDIISPNHYVGIENDNVILR